MKRLVCATACLALMCISVFALSTISIYTFAPIRDVHFATDGGYIIVVFGHIALSEYESPNRNGYHIYFICIATIVGAIFISCYLLIKCVMGMKRQ